MCRLTYLVTLALLLKLFVAQEVPYFRVLAPQFLCSNNGNATDTDTPSPITIALQTRGSQRLTYKVQIYFKLIDGFKSQRHTLSVWRSIRALEKRIRNEKVDISQKNQIDILNEELIPGAEYTFNIVGVDDQGRTSPAQNFTITYRGTGAVGFDQESGSSGGDISFLLVGTWSIYRNMPFLMQGIIIFCDPNPFYKFHWRVSGLTKDSSRYAETAGKSLLIPGGLLQAGSTHEVSVEVEKEGGNTIAKARGLLTVSLRDFQVQLVPNNQSIGINRRIIYTVYVDNYVEEIDQLKVSWSCHPDLDCKVEKGKTFSQTFSYSKAGLYLVFVSLTLNGVTKNESAFVQVQPNIIASVEVTSIDPFNVVAGRSFSAKVRINYLTPQCIAEWYSLGDDKIYNSINSSTLENGFGRMTLNDLETSFLSELLEYENDTTSYLLTLLVPETSKGFSGFVGNGIYLFRLLITCPGLIKEENGNVTVGESTTSYVDLILRSNEPPVVEELDVSPVKGLALQTLFKFSTAPALDSPGDYPMRYRFYYKVSTFWVLIGDFYENTVISTELPYIKAPIQTMYVVCDSRNACSRVPGPHINVTMTTKLSATDIKFKMDAVNGSLIRRDFVELFERAVGLIWTVYNWGDATQMEVVDKFTHDLLSPQLETLKDWFKSTDEYNSYVAKRTLQEWWYIANKVSNEVIRSEIAHTIFPNGISPETIN